MGYFSTLLPSTLVIDPRLERVHALTLLSVGKKKKSNKARDLA